MKVLVTGGAGFIGSHFIAHLKRTYPAYEVHCLDALTYAGNRERLREVEDHPGFRFIHGDIADENLVMALFKKEGYDYVVNFAAETHVDRSIEDAGVFIRTNVLGTQVLLEGSRRFGAGRFHQISTDEVYGDLPLEEDSLPFTEEAPLRGSSPYAASKAAADLLVMAYDRTYGMDVVISRASNNYGPWQHPEKLIPMTIERGIQGLAVPVYGEGENLRDWLYVTDHCEAVDGILHRGGSGEIYNVGTGKTWENIEVVKTILSRLEASHELISHVADRPGHDLRYALDVEKISKELAWFPRVDFEEGLRRTIAWHLEKMKTSRD
jgi:dTDP-glucose 4,6-dehydratase